MDALHEKSLREVAEKGEALYETVRDRYEPHFIGKVLAIDVEAAEFYMADTAVEAMEKAEAANPNSRRFVMRIGYPALETIISIVGPR